MSASSVHNFQMLSRNLMSDASTHKKKKFKNLAALEAALHTSYLHNLNGAENPETQLKQMSNLTLNTLNFLHVNTDVSDFYEHGSLTDLKEFRTVFTCCMCCSNCYRLLSFT